MIKERIFKNVTHYFLASLFRGVFSLAINPLIALSLTHSDTVQFNLLSETDQNDQGNQKNITSS